MSEIGDLTHKHKILKKDVKSCVPTASLILSLFALTSAVSASSRAQDASPSCSELLSGPAPAQARVIERIPGLYESIPATPELQVGRLRILTEQTSKYVYTTRFSVNRVPKPLSAGFVRQWKQALKNWFKNLALASGSYPRLDPKLAEATALQVLRDFALPQPGLAELEAVAYLMSARFNSPERLAILGNLDDLAAIETHLRDLRRDPQRILETDFELAPALLQAVFREFDDLAAGRNFELLIHHARLQSPYQARVIRRITETQIEFDSAFFDRDSEGGIPKIINDPNTVPMIPGKGTPTLTYLTLHQMRLAGIQPGQLTTAIVSDIKNVRTGLEMANHPKIREWYRVHPDQPVNDALLKEVFLESQTGKYVETILRQSGHEIESIDFVETPPRLPPSFIPTSLSEYPRDALLLLNRLKREGQASGERVLIYYHFNIQINLRPSELH